MSDDRIHLFKEFTLDLARGCLMRAAEPVHLRPQTYEVLRYLVEHQGHLISKDKLIEEVWQGRAVTDGSLGKCIEEVREALGADARQYVRNVRGRGYIFDPGVGENGKGFSVSSEEIDVIRVVVEDEKDDDGGAIPEGGHEHIPTGYPLGSLELFSQQVEGADRVNRTAKMETVLQTAGPRYVASRVQRYQRTALLLLPALVIAAAAFAYFRYSDNRPLTITSIAVLPFANASGDPNMEYLSDGIGESVINSLSGLPNMRVMSRNAVVRFKGQETDALRAGRELGVQAVLTGRVIRQGDLFSVSVELVNAGDNTHIWGEQYHRKPTDLLSLQSEIAGDVSRQIRARLSAAGTHQEVP